MMYVFSEPNVERENLSVVLAQKHVASHFQSFLGPAASVAEEIDQQVRKRLKVRSSTSLLRLMT